MKILFVSSGTSREGISPLVFNQGESLRKQGISIEYFTINSKGFPGYFRYIFKLKSLLRRSEFDLLHAHYGLSGLVALFAKRKKQKLIVSFMGTDLLGNHNRLNKSFISWNLLVWINQQLTQYTDAVIVKSNEMSRKISCLNKYVIPNGVNLSEFCQIDKTYSRKKLGWANQSKYVFFMADPKRPEKNYALAFKAVKQLGIHKIKLQLLLDIPSSEVVYYYNASDVCILTSFHEGSPNVIKEAMACNRPIVSTMVGDINEIFAETKGCYISSFDHNDLADKIEKAIEFSVENRVTLGRNRIIELGLDSETIAKRIVKVYEKVLNS
jgi:teichuronic acid biosynthesis glycosyltransferase TuaC